MGKILLFFVFLFQFKSSILHAQELQRVKIKGIVLDEDKTPFEAVEVNLYSNKQFLITTKTNHEGIFIFQLNNEQLEKDSLNLMVETIGYKPFRLLIDKRKILKNRFIRIDLKSNLWLNGYNY